MLVAPMFPTQLRPFIVNQLKTIAKGPPEQQAQRTEIIPAARAFQTIHPAGSGADVNMCHKSCYQDGQPDFAAGLHR